MPLFKSLKAYGVSLSLHTLLLSSFWIASAQIVSEKKAEPITIDFTLGDGEDNAPAPIPPQASAPKPTVKKNALPAPEAKPDETLQPVFEEKIETAESDTLANSDTLPETETAVSKPDNTPKTAIAIPTASAGTAAGTGLGSQGKSDKISVYLKNQFIYIRKIITENIIYPERARDQEIEGALLLSFVILENGSVAHVMVVKSSGSSLLDDSAVATVYKSAPFPKPPFPAELKIPITYKLL